LENVRVSCVNDDRRPVMICDGVESLKFEDFVFPRVAGAPEWFLLENVDRLQVRQDDVEVVEPRSTALRLEPGAGADRFVAGRPFSAVVTVENGDRPGLGKIDCTVTDDTTTNWVWLRPSEEKQVVFRGLTVSVPGRHEITTGHLRQTLSFDKE
jgi:hypothetical protein